MTKTGNWTKEEFKAYLLIYAAQTNFIEAEEELEFIESRFNKDVINKIRKEIKNINDYQKVQIIINYINLMVSMILWKNPYILCLKNY